MEAAIQVFEKRGYQGTTTNHIAERAGVSVGSVYQYFPNKKSILFHLMADHIASLVQSIEEMMPENQKRGRLTKKGIKKIVEALVRAHREETAYHKIALSEVPEAQKELLLMAAEAERKIAKKLEGIIESTPESRKKDAGVAALTFTQTANWLTHRYTLFSAASEEADQVFVDETTDILSRYILDDSSTI